MKIHALYTKFTIAVFTVLTIILMPPVARGQDQADELAKQLANPVAALISVPFQFNYDTHVGPVRDGQRFTVNLQPVVPFELSDKWNLITRTILPFIHQRDIFPGAGHQTGLGDTVATLFLSPRPGPSGVIWGVGPVFLLPTATDDLLGTGKWGVGLSGVLLRQSGLWTYGGLVNHIESVAGEGGRNDVSSTFLNPFISRRFEGGWTLGTQIEHALDHKNHQHTGQWMVFLSKVTHIGKQNVSINVVPKYWYEDSIGSAKDFGIRVTVSLLFPR